MPTRHLLIRGKVQGVFYRASAHDKAEELGLKGWVRNTPDGHVEAVATGSQEQLDAFIAWCHQGPTRAIVTGVDVKEVAEQSFDDFSIIRK